MPQTEKPSVFISYGEQAWERPEFDFRLHGGGATLLSLPPDSYDKVLLFPYGRRPQQNYDISQAERFTNSLMGIRKLLSYQAMLGDLAKLGKGPDKVITYMPGFFASNEESWKPTTASHRYVVSMNNFANKLHAILMYLRDIDGTPKCKLCWDASGGDTRFGALVVEAFSMAALWGFENLTEGHPYPGSAFQSLHSITTAWHALESPTHYLSPTAWRGIMCVNSSGIGRADGVYQEGRPVGVFGRDHRMNYIPSWRNQERDIYLSVFGFGRDGTPPECWVDSGGAGYS